MRLYFYGSHLGGFYTSEYPLSDNDLYCEQCECCDTEIGSFDSAVDVLKFLAEEIDIYDCGGYDLKYILNLLVEFDDCPSYEEAIKIISEAICDSLVHDNFQFTAKLNGANYKAYLTNYEYSDKIDDYILYFSVENTAQVATITLKQYFDEVVEYEFNEFEIDLTKE